MRGARESREHIRGGDTGGAVPSPKLLVFAPLAISTLPQGEGGEIVLRTASRQPSYLASRVFASIRGSKRSIGAGLCANSSGGGQIPIANPARYAAPTAVVSRTGGRSTVTSRISARNCSTQSLAAMPPSTRKTVFAPAAAGQSSRIASSKSRV